MNWNSLTNKPFNKWPKTIQLKAISANSTGQVNSFIAIFKKQRYYGYRVYTQQRDIFQVSLT